MSLCAHTQLEHQLCQSWARTPGRPPALPPILPWAALHTAIVPLVRVADAAITLAQLHWSARHREPRLAACRAAASARVPTCQSASDHTGTWQNMELDEACRHILQHSLLPGTRTRSYSYFDGAMMKLRLTVRPQSGHGTNARGGRKKFGGVSSGLQCSQHCKHRPLSTRACAPAAQGKVVWNTVGARTEHIKNMV